MKAQTANAWTERISSGNRPPMAVDLQYGDDEADERRCTFVDPICIAQRTARSSVWSAKRCALTRPPTPALAVECMVIWQTPPIVENAVKSWMFEFVADFYLSQRHFCG